MSQETQKYKLKEYNFATDSTQDFVNGVAGVSGNGSKSNMQIIEDEIDRVDNKVRLDGATQTNFNFIPNEVVQDGLLYMNNDVNSNKVDTSVIDGDCIYISARAKAVNVGTVFFPFGNHKSSFPFTGFALQVNKNGENKVQLYISLEDGTRLTPVVSINIDTSLYNDYTLYKNGKMITLIVNNKIVYSAILEKNYAKSPINIYLGVVNGDSNANCITTNAVIYNRQLTPQEFEHNLQVFNSPPSLTLLETTSSDGTKVKHLFHSTDDVVEMGTGRTLRQEYMGLLKQSGKEFVADETGKITVDNGLEARLISVVIDGNTVKNYYDIYKASQAYSILSIEDNVANLELNVANQNARLISNTLELKENSSYVIQYEIKMPKTGASRIYIDNVLKHNLDYNSVNTWVKVSVKLDITTFTTKTVNIHFNTSNNLVIGDVVEIRNINVLDYTDAFNVDFYNKTINSFIPFGLSSTQAIISNNGMKSVFEMVNEEGVKEVIELGGTSTKKDKLELLDDGSGIITYNTSDSEDGSSRVDLATPITTHIPKELMSVIATQQTNNLSVDSPVQPSSFKATVPVDKVAILETELKRIASIVDTPKNIALLDNYVEDEYNKNQKEEGVM